MAATKASQITCKCGKPAVIFRAFEGRALCKEQFSEALERRIDRTIAEHKLLEKGDHIVVGLSGGKDSSATLYTMARVAAKRPHLNLKISAVLVDEGIGGYRDKSVPHAERFCKKMGVLLNIVSFKKHFGMTLDEMMRRVHSLKLVPEQACTYCGVFRRHLLNITAREIGATKVAVGHNLDDEAQSIMLNWIKGDMLRHARMGARTARAARTADFYQDFVPRIKPLREVPEKEVALYAILKGLDVDMHSDCPYAAGGMRFKIRDFINELEAERPGIKNSIVRTFDRLQPYIKKAVKPTKMKRCVECGEPASRVVCKVCELRKIVLLPTESVEEERIELAAAAE